MRRLTGLNVSETTLDAALVDDNVQSAVMCCTILPLIVVDLGTVRHIVPPDAVTQTPC